jgi:hypothetical protein
VCRLFDENSWRDDRSLVESLVRPKLPTYHVGHGPAVSSGRYLHAFAALPDFEVGTTNGLLRWKRKPAADFRIPLYRDFLTWHAEDASQLVPREPKLAPKVPDKMLSWLQIRLQLQLPSSEISSSSSCSRKAGNNKAANGMSRCETQPDSLISRPRPSKAVKCRS